MAKRTKTAFTSKHAPLAIFLDKQSLEENLPCAIEETRIIAEYREDGDEASLWVGLTEIGWDCAAIQMVIADPAYQARTIYGLASSF